MLLQEGHQHHTDDIREELSALRLGQRRYAVDDRRGGAEDEALELGLVHHAGLRLEPGGLQQLAHAGGDDAVKLAGVGDHFTLRSLERRAARAARRECYPSDGGSPSQGDVDRPSPRSRANAAGGALVSRRSVKGHHGPPLPSTQVLLPTKYTPPLAEHLSLAACWLGPH